MDNSTTATMQVQVQMQTGNYSSTEWTISSVHSQLSLFYKYLMLSIQIFVVPCAAFGLVLNLIACYTIWRCRNFIAANPRLITINQTLCDSFCCAMIIPFEYTSLDGFEPSGGGRIRFILCFFWYSGYILWSQYCVSIWNNLILTVERYVAICFVFNKWFTRSRVITLCVLCHVSGFLFVVQVPIKHMYYNEDGRCGLYLETNMFKIVYGPAAALLHFFLPILFTVVLYSHITIYLSRQSRIPVLSAKRTSNSSVRISKIAVAITVLHTIATGPVSILYTVVDCVFGNGVLFFIDGLYPALMLLYQFVPIINPLIITFAYSNFWPTFRKMLSSSAS